MCGTLCFLWRIPAMFPPPPPPPTHTHTCNVGRLSASPFLTINLAWGRKRYNLAQMFVSVWKTFNGWGMAFCKSAVPHYLARIVVLWIFGCIIYVFLYPQRSKHIFTWREDFPSGICHRSNKGQPCNIRCFRMYFYYYCIISVKPHYFKVPQDVKKVLNSGVSKWLS